MQKTLVNVVAGTLVLLTFWSFLALTHAVYVVLSAVLFGR